MKDKALIIFAKQPVPGTVKTRLIPELSPEGAAQLYLSMLTDILNNTFTIADVDRMLFYDGGGKAEDYFRESFPAWALFPQEGDDLGRRMETAFCRTFAGGYQSVVIIGTDSPDLPASFIEDTFRLLEDRRTDVVLGPATDGGYYLLGMKRLHRELFSGISWSTGRVLQDSLKIAESLGLGTKLLPPWHDIDTFADLERLKKTHGANGAPLTMVFIGSLDIP